MFLSFYRYPLTRALLSRLFVLEDPRPILRYGEPTFSFRERRATQRRSSSRFSHFLHRVSAKAQISISTVRGSRLDLTYGLGLWLWPLWSLDVVCASVTLRTSRSGRRRRGSIKANRSSFPPRGPGRGCTGRRPTRLSARGSPSWLPPPPTSSPQRSESSPPGIYGDRKREKRTHSNGYSRSITIPIR